MAHYGIEISRKVPRSAPSLVLLKQLVSFKFQFWGEKPFVWHSVYFINDYEKKKNNGPKIKLKNSKNLRGNFNVYFILIIHIRINYKDGKYVRVKLFRL